MKISNRILSFILALLMLITLPITAQASTRIKSPYNGNTYTISKSQEKKIILHGIDVSEHNGDIDWSKVKKNADFAIIRIGFRGYSTTGKVIKDKKFDENIKNARANGVPVGIYFYSQAITTAEAKEEANATIQWLDKNELDYPIFFDYEFASVSSGRLDSAWRTGRLNKEKMTNIAIAYMSAIRSTGRDAMIYASRSFLEDNVSHSAITDNGFGIWVAEYNSSTPFAGKYVGWQYSSVGAISGISGRIDCNFWFVDSRANGSTFTVDPLKSKYYTGEEILPLPTVKDDDILLEQDKDYQLIYSSNKNVGTASIAIIGIGDYAKYEQKTVYFDILPKTVTGLSITNRTTNSLTAKWDSDSYSAEYDVQVYRGGKWKYYATTKENTIKITDLKPATIYNVRIKPRKNVNGIDYNGKYSPSVKDATIPEKMSKVIATPSEKSVKLSWSKMDNATGYQLYKYDYSKDKYYLLKDTDKASYTDIDLKPNTIQRYRIRAYKRNYDNTLVYGKYSSKTIIYTNPIAPKLSRATSPKRQRIKPKWEKVNGVTGYQVQWSTSSDFSYNTKLVFVKGADKTSTTIKTAQSKKQYYIRVRSYKTRNGNRQYSSWSKALPVKVK